MLLLASIVLSTLAQVPASPFLVSPLGPVATEAVLSNAFAFAFAAVDGDRVLAEVDRRAGKFKDQSYTAKMAIKKGGQLQKTLEFDLTMKGLVRQLIVFRAPGDVAGMKVLMEDADTLYVYSPEFKKVRRIAAHMQNQGFLGSTFTYEDMSQTQLSGTFTATFEGKTGTETVLVLQPRSGKASTYPKLRVTIDAQKGGVTKVQYFDEKGSLVREQLREGWQTVGGLAMPTQITMRNLKANEETVISLSNVKIDQGVDDALFSRRELQR